MSDFMTTYFGPLDKQSCIYFLFLSTKLNSGDVVDDEYMLYPCVVCIVGNIEV